MFLSYIFRIFERLKVLILLLSYVSYFKKNVINYITFWNYHNITCVISKEMSLLCNERLPLEINCGISQKHIALFLSVCKHFIPDIVKKYFCYQIYLNSS
jgi:hypothetical protein